MMEKRIRAPFLQDTAENLSAGDIVFLSGTIFTARDAAHRRMTESLQRGDGLPIDIRNQVIYYAGPSPARPGSVIGAIGPTTSSRMDSFTPSLLRLGLIGMIGKGNRSREVIEAMITNNSVYFAASGGAGALISKCVNQCTLVAYSDLGPEAIYRLTVQDFPLIVAIDSKGNNLYLR